MVKDEDLLGFGWAPGGYVIRCCDCPPGLPFREQGDGAKRSWRCRMHAIEQFEKARAWKTAGLLRFNTNDSILIKLTTLGLAIMREEHRALAAKLPQMGEFEAPKTDEHGYSRMQLWVVMRTFGPHITMGGRAPFETTIAIPMGKG
jgi:hypothetical protein